MRILDRNVFAIRYLIFTQQTAFPSADVDELRAEFSFRSQHANARKNSFRCLLIGLFDANNGV